MWYPTVSVVMCTYNGAKFLKEQVDSILNQTYSIEEFLIFDDGSTDGTLEILEAYAAKFSFINLFKNSFTLGYNKNFEQALKKANSEVIAIADQDDYWDPKKLEKMISYWDPEMPLIHCNSQRFTNEIPQKKIVKKSLRRFRGNHSRKLFFHNSVNGHALLLKRSFVNQILPFEKGIYYDWWSAFIASCFGGVGYLDEVLVFQRVHEKNASITNEINKKASFFTHREEATRHIKKFIGFPGIKEYDFKLGTSLYKYLSSNNSLTKKFCLFFLIFLNRKDLFSYKKRKIDLLSHIKYAYLWAFS